MDPGPLQALCFKGPLCKTISKWSLQRPSSEKPKEILKKIKNGNPGNLPEGGPQALCFKGPLCKTIRKWTLGPPGLMF